MASTRKKASKKKKIPAGRNPISWLRPALWTIAFGITLAGLVAILLLPHKDTNTIGQPEQKHTSETRQETVRQIPETKPVVSEKPRPFVYEESIGADFDLRVWEADLAIIQTLSLMGHGEDRMVHKRIEPRFFYGTPYHFQEITIYTSNSRDEFISKLRDNLDRFLSNVSLKHEVTENRWSININGQKTHIISLEKILKKPIPGFGKLVIIIDDLGGSLEFAKALSRLNFPVIFSILPHMPRTGEVVNFALNNNIETMLHLPMEPKGYPQGIEPGPGALFVNMDHNEIRQRVADNLAQIPDAIGVNNHMGSRFTQDYYGMSIVFDELKKSGLFFLDSMTTSKSVGEKLAREKNIDFFKRHVFLDNVQDKKAIVFQLSKAENIAVKHGMAVAIGHPYPETLEALKEWNGLRNQNVEVVRVSELIAARKYRTAFQDYPEAAN